MITRKDPTEIAETILKRSVCLVQVGSCIADKTGVFSWGWNSVGKGFGLCAETHAIIRANKKRLRGATIFIAGQWAKGKIVASRPCQKCQKLINVYGLNVIFRDKDGEWKSG